MSTDYTFTFPCLVVFRVSVRADTREIAMLKAGSEVRKALEVLEEGGERLDSDMEVVSTEYLPYPHVAEEEKGDGEDA